MTTLNAQEAAAIMQAEMDKQLPEPLIFDERMLQHFTCEKVEQHFEGVKTPFVLYYTKMGAHPTYQLYESEAAALWHNLGEALGYAEPTARNYWKEFTYKEALCGIYWVCGTYTEYDIDVDYVGRDILVTTGEMCQFVSLVYIDFNPEDPAAMMVDAIDCHNLGSFSDEHLISHYMEFEIPAHGIKEQE